MLCRGVEPTTITKETQVDGRGLDNGGMRPSRGGDPTWMTYIAYCGSFNYVALGF